jgi:serine/threonine protein kinase
MEMKICQSCGKPLTAKAVSGLCPECFMKVGLGSETGEPPGPKSGRFTPPDLRELAEHFPQLEILGLIGQGGMGAVYKARQKELDRFVALKILPSHAGDERAFAERFAREARALARLNQPHIVAVHDFGRAGEFYYFLMEYIDGVTLRHLMRERRLKPAEALQIVPQVCEALQYAHNQGVVHRDIKPENILIDKSGCVKIADFGLAKLGGADRGSQRLTQPREVMGTPHYMAPEQVEHPQEVDHRADIYSLGVVLYEMLTGELPLGKFAPPSRKVQVDVRLDEVVLHALEKEPELRYQQAEEVKTDVETIATTAHPGPAAALGAERTKPHLGKIGDLGLVVRILGILGLGFVLVLALAPRLRTQGSLTDARPDQANAAGKSAWPAPPVVIKTFPEAGANEVDPSLTELRVTFSSSMLDHSWSWIICDEENFPKFTGSPKYLADGRTCVLPVKLDPGRVYATWLNNEKIKGFCDREGRPAIPYLLVFETKKMMH